MTVPILGRQEVTAADVITDFLKRRAANNVTNASRDNCISALCMAMEAVLRQHMADHPERVKAVEEQMEAAVREGSDDATGVVAPGAPE